MFRLFLILLLVFGCDKEPTDSSVDYCDVIEGEWVGLIKNVTYTDACPGEENIIDQDISHVLLIISQEDKTVQAWENGELVQVTDFSECNDNQLQIVESDLGVYGSATFSIDGNLLTTTTIIQGNPSDDCVVNDISIYQQLIND